MKLFTGLSVCLLMGCFQRPGPVQLPDRESQVVMAAVEEWQASGLPWSEHCEWTVERILVDRRTDRCINPRDWECVEAYRVIHIAPDIDTRGPGAYENTLAHAMGHVLGMCSGLGPDPAPVDLEHKTLPGHHWVGWEQSPDGWLRRTQRSMGLLPD